MIETVQEADCLSLQDNRKSSEKLEKESFSSKRNFKKEQQENYSAVNINQFMRINKLLASTQEKKSKQGYERTNKEYQEEIKLNLLH